MKWNRHLNLEGKHAFLGASSYHWLNYDDEKLISTYNNKMAALKGTELHEFAATCIKLRQRLPKSNKTINMYVNDAIGFGMSPEVLLYYSPYCFGTADSIGVRKNVLRIHDLKTGITPAHMEQLYIYAALFCLEYRYKPSDFETIETAIYQSDSILIDNPTSEIIVPIMDKIEHYNKILTKLDVEGGLINELY